MESPHTDTEGESPVIAPEQTWQRVHAITPLVRTWKVLTALAAVAGLKGLESLPTLLAIWRGEGLIGTHLFLVIGIIVAITAVFGGWLWLAWRRMGYRLDAETLHVRSGVVFTENRRVPLDRVQAVAIARPFLARILGLGNVVVESAGGADSNVTIGLLDEARLARLRDNINDAAARVRRGEAEPEPDAVDEAADSRARWSARWDADDTFRDGERRLYTMPTGDFLHSQLRSLTTLGALAVLVGVCVWLGIIVWQSPPGAESLGAIIKILPANIPLIAIAWHRLSGIFDHYRCRIDVTQQGLRISRGLLSTQSQTLAPGRIHGIVLKQDPLWRARQWWSIDLIIAAYQGEESDAAKASMTLTPLATPEQVRTFVEVVLPGLANDPEGDRQLTCLLHGRGDEGGFLPPARGARYFSPLQRPRLGAIFTEHVFATRSGWLYRKAHLLDARHIQAAAVTQGPFDRRFAMADVSAHTVGSLLGHNEVRAYHLSLADAQALYERLSAASGWESDDEPLRQWLTRVLPLTHEVAPESEAAVGEAS